MKAPRFTYGQLKTENSRRLRLEIARGETRLGALPEIVTLNSTDICNLRCVMCPRNLAQGVHRLEDRVVAFVCDELFPTALKANLTTAGGEPLGPGFDLILERARRYEVKIDVVTNGLLLTPETFLEMRPVLDHLNVSVDCSVPEIYERIRLGGSFARLRQNLEKVREIRRRSPDDLLYSMSAVVMTSNLPHLPELVRFAAEQGAAGLVLQQLRHEIKPTWDEEPTRHFSPEEIEGHLARTEAAAREHGMHLYQFELGRPNRLAGQHRGKVPDPLAGAGVCYFLSQSFSVMYTGEVYPCCKPTDYKLGDVRYEHPVDIWNGEPLRQLREAHHSRRGTLFCSGCEYAPHLPARRSPAVDNALRTGRRAYAHVANGVVRSFREKHSERIFEAQPCAHRRIDGAVSGRGLATVRSRRLAGAREASAMDPRDGSLWFVSDSTLHHAADPVGPSRAVMPLPNENGGEAACLVFLDPAVLLCSFEGSGQVLGIDVASAQPSARSILQLVDGRSWIRQGGVARSRNGTIWVGEYGTHPGARCARLYRSRDHGGSFELVRHFERTRHIHSVAWLSASAELVVTTGDLAAEQATWTCEESGRSYHRVYANWAGFTAVIGNGDYVHLGTDLPGQNGFLRVPAGKWDPPEYRPLEGDLDLQVRQIEALGNGRLLALARLDEDLTPPETRRLPSLFLSEDAGSTWSCIHRFQDEPAAPERFVVLEKDPIRIVTDGTQAPLAIEVTP